MLVKRLVLGVGDVVWKRLFRGGGEFAVLVVVHVEDLKVGVFG